MAGICLPLTREPSDCHLRGHYTVLLIFFIITKESLQSMFHSSHVHVMLKANGYSSAILSTLPPFTCWLSPTHRWYWAEPPPRGRPASQCCLRSLWRAEDTVFFLNISCVLLWTLNISRFMLLFASGLCTLPAHEDIRGLMYLPGVCSLHRCLGHLQQGEGTMADNSAPGVNTPRPLDLIS